MFYFLAGKSATSAREAAILESLILEGDEMVNTSAPIEAGLMYLPAASSFEIVLWFVSWWEI